MLTLRRQLWIILAMAIAGSARASETPARQILVQAMRSDKLEEQRTLLSSLIGNADAAIPDLLAAWRNDELFLYPGSGDERVPIHLTGEPDAEGARAAERVLDGQPLADPAGRPLRLNPTGLTAVEHNAALRRAMRVVLDLLDLGAPDPATRVKAIQTIGQSQDPEKLAPLQTRLDVEKDPAVLRALREAVALIRLNDSSASVKVAALRELEALHTLSSSDFIERCRKEALAAGDRDVAAAADAAVRAVESHRATVDFFGTLFRGLSLGSILLVGALGLAITFGLMRVINMAHGEMIAVGAYATYLVQNFFGDGMTIPFFGLGVPLHGLKLNGWAYQAYFIVALPVSFLVAALVGLVVERSVIRFLYRRPLESLLATWGVSLVLQQVFRLMFGANNVQVSSPSYLSGNWVINDVLLGWNRVFVIGFAIAIVLGVWLALVKTPLGLLIRATMQNRSMASCIGVRTDRVNMLTFAFGSGLAGLAGAFLSQIGNVGPALGQTYIIDSFMVVVVGGVGSIGGTIVSAFGIGGVDQVLQQYLPVWAPALGWVPGFGSFLQNLAQDAAVFGKILVLGGIILFLQWRPAGLFVTRSRSLDE